MAERPAADLVQRLAAELVDLEVSHSEAEALAALYGATARGVAAFPTDELRLVEPPLRSVAGPGPRP
jgi:hypothetical protein